MDDLAVTSGTASKAAMRHELGAEVRDALQTLSERDRQVIQWCHFEQKSHQEVSALLGITESHARVLLARLAQAARRSRLDSGPPRDTER